jgi:hypothetical protein
MPSPRAEPRKAKADARSLYIHAPRGRRGRAIDDRTEEFVEATRMGAED